MRKLLVMISILGAAAFGAAFAQSTGVSVALAPTTGGGGMYNTGSAAGVGVNQNVSLTLPTAYGLAIDNAENLNFDLSSLGTSNSQLACVTAIPNSKGQVGDVSQTVGVWPLGTHYTIGGSFPDINVQGGSAVTSYPPVAYTGGSAANGVSLASKQEFVCYKSFILEKFANVPGWTVTVSRSDATGNNLDQMYIQDNVCGAAFGNATGLLPLVNGASAIDLFQGGADAAYQNLTTGGAAESAQCNYGGPTSWLNDLVVLAIKIDGQQAGTQSTTLTYTIQATNPQ